MTKIVLVFGLISGAIVAALMWLMLGLAKAGFSAMDHGTLGMIWGYATMVIALSLVFFGIKSYRDNNGGKISFLKGLQIGILISLISALCYGISWEVYYRTSGGEFMQQYSASYVAQLKEKGASDAEIAETQKQLDQLTEQYKNFLFRFAITLTEILPVGIIVALVSAALLRKKGLVPVSV